MDIVCYNIYYTNRRLYCHRVRKVSSARNVCIIAVGVILGIAAGCAIEIYNIHSVKFYIIYVPVWIYAVEFMVVISAIILQKVKKLKLMDAAA